MSRARFTRRSLLQGVAFGTLAACASPRVLRAREPSSRVYLQPLGAGLEANDVQRIRESLQRGYGVPITPLPVSPLPQQAYYAPRKRYRAERLLDHLVTRLPRGGSRILGVTNVDISTTKGANVDWGVLGLAKIGGPAGVVSSFRCRTHASSAEQASERFRRVAVHELGHCFGLPHCLTTRCVMRDAESRIATIDDSDGLCASCRSQLRSQGIFAS